MLRSGSALEITSGLSEDVLAAWADHEAQLDRELREEIPGICVGTSLVALAIGMLNDVEVPESFRSTVFCRRQGGLTTPYREAGIQLRPASLETPPINVLFCTLPPEGYIPALDVEPIHAAYVSIIALRKVLWARQRRLELNADGTGLRVPTTASAKASLPWAPAPHTQAAL
jgi:hypothetical protein